MPDDSSDHKPITLTKIDGGFVSQVADGTKTLYGKISDAIDGVRKYAGYAQSFVPDAAPEAQKKLDDIKRNQPMSTAPAEKSDSGGSAAPAPKKTLDERYKDIIKRSNLSNK